MSLLAGVEQRKVPVHELFQNDGPFATDLRIMGAQRFSSIVIFPKGGTVTWRRSQRAGGEIGLDRVKRLELTRVEGETTLVANLVEGERRVILTGTEAELAPAGIVFSFPDKNRSVTLETQEKQHNGGVILVTNVRDVET